MTISVSVFGRSHLAQTLCRAAGVRRFDADFAKWDPFPDIIFAAEDVLDHEDMGAARRVFDEALAFRGDLAQVINKVPVILVSQVAPGTTRDWACGRHNVFYQVDTIIMRNALQRACSPEQIIVGCADPSVALPLTYQEYLLAHQCPVLQMTYESAEFAKCAINFALARQVETANLLHAACGHARADYDDVRRALHGDARIGPYAYLRPGEPNQHLKRDVDTVNALQSEVRGEALVDLNRRLSDAYVRLRYMIPGALDTPRAPTPEQVWETTEAALRKLREKAGVD